jgi:hypothetical protein
VVFIIHKALQVFAVSHYLSSTGKARRIKAKRRKEESASLNEPV